MQGKCEERLVRVPVGAVMLDGNLNLSEGAVPLAAQHDVAEASSIARPPKGRESVPAQITRLLDAHEQILIQSRRAAREASENGDDGTNDLILSEVIRTNETHVFFLSEHLADGDPHGHQKTG